MFKVDVKPHRYYYTESGSGRQAKFSMSAYLLMLSIFHFQELKRRLGASFVVYNTKKKNLFPVTRENVAGAMRK